MKFRNKILITGGAGYIGSHTVLTLLDKGHNVSVIDNLITGTKKLIPKKAKFYNCDIGDDLKIEKIIQKNSFDAVIHFAGLIKVEESVRYPKKYNLFNYLKSKSFIDNCIKNNWRFLMLSYVIIAYFAAVDFIFANIVLFF